MTCIKYKINGIWLYVENFDDEILNDAVELNCSYNHLTSLPDWQHLTKLQRIDCSLKQFFYYILINSHFYNMFNPSY